MTATRKTTRFLTVLALIFAMVLSIVSVPASAAGVETWYGGYVSEGSFGIDGTNTTPRKTMGVSGQLDVVVDFVPKGSVFTQINYTVQIRDTAGRVLASQQLSSMLPVVRIPISLTVTQGQEIQLYFSAKYATTNQNVNASVSYSHSIS